MAIGLITNVCVRERQKQKIYFIQTYLRSLCKTEGSVACSRCSTKNNTIQI